MGDLDYLLSGAVNEKVYWHRELDVWGDRVYGGRRTIAHLEHTDALARQKFSAARNVGIQVIQGAFNTDVAASAGTHDYDGCLDVFIPGVDWWDQQRFFRSMGWAAWYRYPPSFSSHIHMVSLGCTGRMGIYVPGQISDYYNHRTGLAGHYTDNSWHPDNIKSTIFNYSEWRAKQEDDMFEPADSKRLERVEQKLQRIEKTLNDHVSDETRRNMAGIQRLQSLREKVAKDETLKAVMGDVEAALKDLSE